MKKRLLYMVLFVGLFGLVSCVEVFDVPVNETDLTSTLIIEATLINKLSQQKILLSRPSTFEVVNELDSVYDPVYPVRVRPPSIVFERNATVTVNDDQGNSYSFQESSPGTYTSDIEFAAAQGVSYELQIVTTDGTRYGSTPERFTDTASIDEIYALRELNDIGAEGVSIYLDGGSTQANANFYRYTYEETYKIIAPTWQRQDFVLSNYEPCALPVITYDLDIIFRDDEEGKVCYRTDASEAIIQQNTSGLQQNKIERFPVRFIDRNNFIISHRYSILVRQYVQSQNAYNYYEALESFSSNESVFSSVQPGFLEGNITVEGEADKKVLGYFEVAPVTEKRLYFNYVDLFPNEPLPDYAIPCFLTAPPLEHVSYCFTGLVANSCPLSLVESLNINLVSYVGLNSGGLVGVCPGPYIVNYRACGDCTILGESKVPDFWEE